MALMNAALYTPIHGAYTELFAGLSSDVTLDHNGSWSMPSIILSFACLLIIITVIPWGRLTPIRKDLEAAGKSEAEGGTGIATKFWEWSEEQVKPYL
jgi:retinol dehydrogenase-12